MTIYTIALATVAWLVFNIGGFVHCSAAQTTPAPDRSEAVILLHGLGRTKLSMAGIQRWLTQHGYVVYNVDYPSLRTSIKEVSENQVAAAVTACRAASFQRIHFVTHSMGALVLRYYLQDHQLPTGSRIVMLAPPNGGSEVADWVKEHAQWIGRLAGPSAAELHTGTDALHARLNPISPELGVLIGYRSWNPFFSLLIPGNDDGKVSVASARLPEMQDFMLVRANHTTILLKDSIRRQIRHFLRDGRFYYTCRANNT